MRENRLCSAADPAVGSVQTAKLIHKAFTPLIAVDGQLTRQPAQIAAVESAKSLAYIAWRPWLCGRWLHRHCESDP